MTMKVRHASGMYTGIHICGVAADVYASVHSASLYLIGAGMKPSALASSSETK